MGLDTIDIEDLANEFSSDLLRIERDAIVASVIASLPWLAAAGPLAKVATELIGDVAEVILKYLNQQVSWVAFRFNTTVFTTDQGKDYIKTVEERRGMPEDISDADWEAAEERASHAMRNLVNFRK
jgi:Mg2+/citrate symporter